MRIAKDKFLPNPFRDFDLDPIDPNQVERLKNSMEDLGFFSGITARPVGDGFYEIAAGHHRHGAAMKRDDITHIEAVVDNYTDEEMVRIMAIENLTQRGANTGAINDAVAATARILAYSVLTDRENSVSISTEFSNAEKGGLRKATLDQGPGAYSIYAAINGFKHTEQSEKLRGDEKSVMVKLVAVRNAVDTLKTSGHMAKIVGEVFARVEAERAEDAAEAAAEAERQELIRQEAEKKAAEATRLAKEREEKAAAEAKRKKEEAEAAEARKAADAERKRKEADEAEHKRKEAAKILMEKRAVEEKDRKIREAEAAKAKADADAKAAKEADQRKRVKAQQELEKTYDSRCDTLFDPDAARVFREVITGVAAKEYWNRNDHYGIAQRIAADMTELRKAGSDVSFNFVRKWVMEEIDRLDGVEKKRTQEEIERKKVEDQRFRVGDLWNQVFRGQSLLESGINKLAEEHGKWNPANGPFPVTNADKLMFTLGTTSRLEQFISRLFPHEHIVQKWLADKAYLDPNFGKTNGNHEPLAIEHKA